MSDFANAGLVAGATSRSVDLLLRKKTDNTELTGLFYNTIGNIASYRRAGAARVAITLATQTVTGAFSSGGLVEIDATNMPGLYRLDVPDTAWAVGVDYVDVSLVTASGYMWIERFWLSSNVVQTGDSYARLGAPAGASTAADIAAVKTDTAAVKTQTDKLVFTVANQVDVNVIDWKSATAPAMTGDAYARIGAAGAGLTALGDTRIAHLDADVSSRTKPADTQAAVTTVTTVTNLTNAPTAGDFTSAMKTSLNSATPAVTVSDKTGFALSSAGNLAIWDTATSLTTTAGSIGKRIADYIDAAISGTATPAQVKTQVVAALDTDTYAELSAVPPATTTLRKMLQWAFMLSRNKRLTTATTDTVRNDGDSADVGTSTIGDDGTTFTRAKYG